MKVTDKQQSGAIPFVALLGGRVVSADGGRAVVEIDDLAPLMNSRGSIHGGAIAALADIASAQAAASSGLLGEGALTSDIVISYLEPGLGPELRAEAEVMGVYERKLHVRCEVHSGEVVVAAVMTHFSRGRR